MYVIDAVSVAMVQKETLSIIMQGFVGMVIFIFISFLYTSKMDSHSVFVSVDTYCATCETIELVIESRFLRYVWVLIFVHKVKVEWPIFPHFNSNIISVVKYNVS